MDRLYIIVTYFYLAGTHYRYSTLAMSFFIIGSYVEPSSACTILGALPSATSWTASA